LCAEHGDERMRDNLSELRAHSGPYFRRWRERIAASVGGVLLDDLRE
jgi:hypothetical protein